MAGNAPESTNQTTRMGVVNFEIGLQNNPTSKIPVSIYIYHAKWKTSIKVWVRILKKWHQISHQNRTRQPRPNESEANNLTIRPNARTSMSLNIRSLDHSMIVLALASLLFDCLTA
jgi:hypothetical protein